MPHCGLNLKQCEKYKLEKRRTHQSCSLILVGADAKAFSNWRRKKRKGRSEANTKLETTCVFLQYKGILKVCLSFQQYIYTTIVANSFKKAEDF